VKSRLNTYLGFRDNAREAMQFYQSIFGGELTLNTFGEAQASEDPAEQDKIMHSELNIGGNQVLMASDTPNSMEYSPGGSHSLCLNGQDEDELQGYWEKLVDGGNVVVPLEKAPWGDSFGMCVDKFGINGMVNIGGSTS
jgi:PhnB protein